MSKTTNGPSDSPKMNPTSYRSKLKQNNSAELSGYSFNNIHTRKASPDPPSNQTSPSLGFSRFPVGDIRLVEVRRPFFKFHEVILQARERPRMGQKQCSNKARPKRFVGMSGLINWLINCSK